MFFTFATTTVKKTKCMKETVFIRRRLEKWKEMENMVGDTVFATPDDVVKAYNEVTSDLAFAQTQYPDSSITSYLNDLALGLHRDLYRHKHTPWSQIVRYWTHDIPLAVYEARNGLLISLVFFLGCCLVGAVSTLADPEFPRFILGDYYVDMTLDNIAAGNPMAVYSMGSQVGSFLGITINNILVSFIVYIMGIFTCFGTCYYLLNNGVMVGAFITFFVVRGLFAESILAIMLHGTLELSAIVIAGGAGITLGNGWLFPGTYSRMESFLMAARHSAKVLLSTTPIFVLAGFIEGFFTRFTNIGDGFRLMVIFTSAAFVVFYYVLLPIKRHRDASQRK